MPAKRLMTWVKSQKRWLKHYNGTTYSVSAKKLGFPPGAAAEETRAAANAWWVAKQAELDRPGQDAEAARKAMSEELARVAMAGGTFEGVVTALLQAMGDQETTAKVVDTGNRLARAFQQPEAARTVRWHVDSYLTWLKLKYEAGDIAPGRLDAYRREIEVFAAWFDDRRGVDEIDETAVDDYYGHLLGLVGKKQRKEPGGISATYAAQFLTTFRQFVSRLCERRVIPTPANLMSKSMKFRKPGRTPETWPLEEVHRILSCDGGSEKTKLYLLLMLNCGMYQNDVSELRYSEVDWDAGVITRVRSKRRHDAKAQVSVYPLWPETLELLRKYRAPGKDRVLLTDEGRPLVPEGLRPDGRVGRTDNIKSAYVTLARRAGMKTRPLKDLRKTSSNLLAANEEYGESVAKLFLSRSPDNVDDVHYLKSNNAKLARGVNWLRTQILPQ